MKITLVLVGKSKESYIDNGMKDYINRIKHYIPFEIKEIAGIKNAGKLSEQELKAKEGKEIKKNIKDNSIVVLLDERGKELSSVKFAKWIQENMNRSIQHLIFVIGGAYGFSEDVKKLASAKLSLSQMTFSHQIVRLIFAEQLYRALTIIKGEPYHHGS